MSGRDVECLDTGACNGECSNHRDSRLPDSTQVLWRFFFDPLLQPGIELLLGNTCEGMMMANNGPIILHKNRLDIGDG